MRAFRGGEMNDSIEETDGSAAGETPEELIYTTVELVDPPQENVSESGAGEAGAEEVLWTTVEVEESGEEVPYSEGDPEILTMLPPEPEQASGAFAIPDGRPAQAPLLGSLDDLSGLCFF